MNETTVSPEMILQVTNVKPSTAERIAVYATSRINGALRADARRDAGISSATGDNYERLLPVLCREFGLPKPRESAPDYRFPQDRRGGHAR